MTERDRGRGDDGCGPGIVVGLNAVIIAVTDEQPRVLTVSVPGGTPMEGGAPAAAEGDGGSLEALPTGPLDPCGDRTLELALRRWVRAQTGLELGYVEQLYTFGDRFRDPRERHGGPRLLSVAYLALVREGRVAGESRARWRGVYRFLPWEDWRNGPPPVVRRELVPAVEAWVRSAPGPLAREVRRERAAVAFGRGRDRWDLERVLDRYELLYEMGLLPEMVRDVMAAGEEPPGAVARPLPGSPLAFDHRRILATALGRIRAKIRYRPVVFELVPEEFTLLRLQRTVEALSGLRLHKQNFRRLVDSGGLVEGTGRLERGTRGRPAELFRFRREVILERPAPGVGLPARNR